jgi:hypothetical protein
MSPSVMPPAYRLIDHLIETAESARPFGHQLRVTGCAGCRMRSPRSRRIIAPPVTSGYEPPQFSVICARTGRTGRVPLSGVVSTTKVSVVDHAVNAAGLATSSGS